jgi:hypothetical protein
MDISNDNGIAIKQNDLLRCCEELLQAMSMDISNDKRIAIKVYEATCSLRCYD